MKRIAFIPALLMLLAGASAAAESTEPYRFSRPAHATLPHPDAAVSTDLDGDGRQDIVAAVGVGTATTSYGVSVLRATEDGFGQPTFSLLPADVVDVAVRDVDGDAVKDVLASTSIGEGRRAAHLLPGTGGGLLGESFETPMTGYTALALGRFTPGRMGAVIATEAGLELWQANGYDFLLDRQIGAETATELLAVDLDADGVDELVAADPDRVTLYRDLNRVASVALGEVVSLTAADTNGDARPEAIATSAAGDVKALDAAFSVVRSVPPTSGAFSTGAGDVDGDGKVDLVRANDVPSVTVAFATGIRKEVPLAQTALAVFVRDATGDGKTDILAVEQYSSVVEVVEADGQGGFAPQRSTVFTNPNGWNVRSADFNNDGNLDVIAAQLNTNFIEGYLSASTGSVLLGDGKGGFTRGGTISTQGTSTGFDVGDVNGDGKTDVLVTDYHSGSVTQYLGNGSGGFGDRTYLPGCPLNDAVVVGDFNGDAYADAAAGCRAAIMQQSLAIYLGSPAGLVPGVVLGVAHSNLPWELHTADLNGDDKTDIIMDSNASFRPCLPDCTTVFASSYDGPITYFLGLGNGAFEPTSREYLVGRRIADSKAADINGDGRDDILAAVHLDDQVQIALGKADGTLAAPYSVDVPEYPISVRTGDVTGDGKVDLVLTHGPAMMSVLPGNGDGTFRTARSYATRGGASGGVVADFTKDGKRDVFLPLGGVAELLVQGR